MEGIKAKDILTAIVAFVGVVVALLLAAAVSWGICALFVWLISLCFDFEFTWLIATGVWLALILASLFLKGNRSNG